MIRAAHIFHHPVGSPARQVAGPVETAPALPERVRHEPLAGQARAAKIAARKSGAADVELADDPDGNRIQIAVEDVQAGMADRTAERGTIVIGIEPMARRPDRRLRRAVQIPHRSRRGDQTPRKVRCQRLAAAQHAAAFGKQRAFAPITMIDQHPPGRRASPGSWSRFRGRRSS